MIPDVSQALSWLENHSRTLKGIQRGIERETLRVNADGSLALTDHPPGLGSALTHKWITTDFAEALLEFVTPVEDDINHMMMLMRDVHRFTARQLGDERMWPLSISYIDQKQEIKLAQYGTSNIGRLKTLYREGLKNRYGALMQTISGVHYNFSLPITFWHANYGATNKEAISAGYFRLIRNYYRFGWIVPYLFGASPVIYSSFLQNRLQIPPLPFKKIDCDIYYLPYATSLRLSELGYTNKSQNNLGIMFNELHEYVARLKKAINTLSEEYEKIGLEKEGKRLQINNNVLQIENELYLPIRPKRVTQIGEAPSDALERRGVEYIEVRSLDVNPFSPIGIEKQQIYFLDMFMIWCVLADAPKMSVDDFHFTHINWNRVILEGRKPDLTLYIGRTAQFSLKTIGKGLFHDLRRLARLLDSVYGGTSYQEVCNELVAYFDNPELTLSSRILNLILKRGIGMTGCTLSSQYHNMLLNEPMEVLSNEDFVSECNASLARQRAIESADVEPFDVFLSKHE